MGIQGVKIREINRIGPAAAPVVADGMDLGVNWVREDRRQKV
jgi:hypothetical protein